MIRRATAADVGQGYERAMSSWPHFLQLTPPGLSGASWAARKYQVTLLEPQLGQGSVRGVSVGTEASRLTVRPTSPSWGAKHCVMTYMEQV